MKSLPVDVVMVIFNHLDETWQAFRLAKTCRFYWTCFYEYDLRRRMKAMASDEALFRIAVRKRDPVVLKVDLRGDIKDTNDTLLAPLSSFPKSIYALKIFSSPGRLEAMKKYIQHYESQWKSMVSFTALLYSSLAFINDHQCLQEFQWLLNYISENYIERGSPAQRLTALDLSWIMTKTIYSLPLDIFMIYEPLLMEFLERNQLDFRADLAFAGAEKHFQQQLS
jgi:hypothetical protein